jgi:dynein heavy chain
MRDGRGQVGREQWLTGPLLDVDAPAAENDVMDWYKKSAKLAKLLEPTHPGLAAVAAKLRESTGEFRKNLPVLVALATAALRQASSQPSWDRISEALGAPPLGPSPDLTLEKMLALGAADKTEVRQATGHRRPNLFFFFFLVGPQFDDFNLGLGGEKNISFPLVRWYAGFAQVLEEISMHASKQFGLEKMLNAMKADWAPLAFEVKDYRTTGTAIIGGLDDVIALLDEHIVKTQTMRGSPFVKGILADCVAWEEHLKYGQSMLDEWVKVQRTWYAFF